MFSIGFVPQGLHITAIRKFIRDHPEVKSDSLTTGDINTTIVKPETAGTGSPYLYKYINTCDEVSGVSYTAPATVFVSHAWRYNFYEVVVDVMEQFATEHPNAYFWFDLFTNDQNDMTSKDFAWFCHKFRSSIRKIGHLLLALSPWNKPIPITRSWCLYEIHSALQDSANVKFSVTLPLGEVKELKTAVTDDSKCIINALTRIRAEDADALHQSDKTSINEAIESEDGGFGHVNIQIKNGLRKWYVEQLQRVVEKEPENRQLLMNTANVMREFGFIDSAMTQYKKSLQLHSAEGNQIAIATCYNNMALIHHTQGEFDRALDCYQKSLSRRQEHYGGNHSEVAESYNNIANVYCAMRNFGEAQKFYEKALQIATELKDNQSDIVATCYNNLANLYTYRGELEKAREYDDEAIAIRSQRFGEFHPGIATAYNSKGNRCFSQKDTAQARAYYDKALAILLQVYGEKHQEVALTYSNIANVCFSLNQFDEALKHYTKSVDISVKALGDDSLHIADTYSNMAELHVKKGELDKALDFHEQARVITSN